MMRRAAQAAFRAISRFVSSSRRSVRRRRRERWPHTSLHHRLNLEQLEDRLLLATWPVPASHEMINSFGAGSPVSAFHFHEGIDIRADGMGGQEVRAARAGTVLWANPDYAGGMIMIDVAGVDEYDSYLHVEGIRVEQGAAVAEGDPLGIIPTTPGHPDGARHLHFHVLEKVEGKEPPSDAPPAEELFLNPFFRFTAAADRDPLQTPPELEDTNNDNKVLLVTRSGKHKIELGPGPVDGDVDLIADAVDSMSSDLPYVSNPWVVGYYIKALFAGSHGVKESGGSAVFTVRLSAASAQDVVVDYATGDPPSGPAATAGVDYTPASGSLTILAGQTEAQVAITIHDDLLQETDQRELAKREFPCHPLTLLIDKRCGTVTIALARVALS